MSIAIDWAPTDWLQGGNHYGYSTLAIKLREAGERCGLFHHDGDSPIAFHLHSPPVFRPTPGKLNALFTMFESTDLPADGIEYLPRADIVIVPCEWNRRVFSRYTRAPVVVCPLGVDAPPTLAERRLSVPFRWLWCGAMNLRKGLVATAMAWDRYFATMPGVELRIKTTALENRHSIGVVERGNFIYDERNLPRAELDALYRDAHGFLFPTLGEGFGLTLAEAMSWGLPCIATNYGGHLDFANPRNCALLPYRLKRLEPGPNFKSCAPDGLYEFATVDPDNLARAMLGVMRDYDNALVMGRRAARSVRRLTWDNSARCLAAILADAQRMARAA